jgi:ribosomal protein S18 acetylase RimI-like enzyme
MDRGGCARSFLSMDLLTDRSEIRARLHTDRIWSVYALGDLLPAVFAKTQWLTPDLTLVLHDYGTCILFAMGSRSMARAMTRVRQWPVHLQIQAPALAEAERVAVVSRRTRMWRMGWSGDRSGWVDVSAARRLTAVDVPALLALYRNGEAVGESPDFFFPSMVEDGVFFGAFVDGALVAAAGTHLYAPAESAAAMGNVYTHREWRGRGLSRLVTCATLGALAELDTVGLNVRVENAAAIRVYESLGFRKHCEFFEALATELR